MYRLGRLGVYVGFEFSIRTVAFAVSRRAKFSGERKLPVVDISALRRAPWERTSGGALHRDPLPPIFHSSATHDSHRRTMDDDMYSFLDADDAHALDADDDSKAAASEYRQRKDMKIYLIDAHAGAGPHNMDYPPIRWL